MRRLIALVAALFFLLQGSMALARSLDCCVQGCGDLAMCVVTACESCASQAVPDGDVVRPLLAAASPALPTRPAASKPAPVVEIWRPPR